MSEANGLTWMQEKQKEIEALKVELKFYKGSFEAEQLDCQGQRQGRNTQWERAEKAEAKVERLRDDACRFYYADGSSVVLSKEETLKKRIKAAGQISRLIEALKEIEELSNCRWSIEKASAALNHKEV